MLPRLAIVLVALVAAAAAALVVVRATLPSTACAVTAHQIDMLSMNMTYDNVKALLGCDGVLLSEQKFDDRNVIAFYAWRGDAWPYGRFEAEFYNKTLQSKTKRWLELSFYKRTQ
jgi:hypothetical protein